jgi:polysaccharide export outer membrane protein
MPLTVFHRAFVIAACGVAFGAGTSGAQSPRATTQPPPTAASAPPSADRARPTQTALADDYKLQAGDKLRIEVYKDAQLSQSVQIRPDGKITLPLVGDVAAMGLTPIDLRERIATALKDYMNNPVVTVIVVEGTSPTAYVVGEVNHPGPVVLQANMTVLQALAVAGGLKDFADAKNIRILRKGLAGQQSIPFNYKDAIKGVGPSGVYLQAGDTVVVPD